MTDRIERELVLPLSPAAAWQVLTDPHWLEDWLADEVLLDLRPGGDACFRSGQMTRTGWVEEVTPPERLAFWWTEGTQPSTRVELTLEPVQDGVTRLHVIECRPIEILDLIAMPLRRHGGATHGPALIAAA